MARLAEVERQRVKQEGGLRWDERGRESAFLKACVELDDERKQVAEKIRAAMVRDIGADAAPTLKQVSSHLRKFRLELAKSPAERRAANKAPALSPHLMARLAEVERQRLEWRRPEATRARREARREAREARREARRAGREATGYSRLPLLQNGIGAHEERCSLPLFGASLAALGADGFAVALWDALEAEETRRAAGEPGPSTLR